ncbi:MAG: 3-isopropylmalate dehydrogenase, partial [Myxococcota bacterium]
GIANPVGAILSGAMMLRHSLKLPEMAALVENAVANALTAGARTRDIGGELGTQAMTDRILAAL